MLFGCREVERRAEKMCFVEVAGEAGMEDIVRGGQAERKQAAKWESKLAGGCLAQADLLYQASALSRRLPQH